jgi:hypothetical protein
VTDEHAQLRSYFDTGAAAFDRLNIWRSRCGVVDRTASTLADLA